MNETVIVTGATGVIGRRICSDLSGAGWRVIAIGRNLETLGKLTEAGRLVEPLVLDLTATTASDFLLSELDRRSVGAVHLVHAARDVTNLRVESGHPTRCQWRDEFQLGVVSAYELVEALTRREAGQLISVVNLASMYGIVAANPGLYDDPVLQSPIHYGVVKAAVIHLTKELAVRLAPRGVRVNAISYGGVEGRADAAFKARYKRMTPQGRMLSENEISGAVAFLLSSAASGITGHNLVVDGGWTIW